MLEFIMIRQPLIDERQEFSGRDGGVATPSPCADVLKCLVMPNSTMRRQNHSLVGIATSRVGGYVPKQRKLGKYPQDLVEPSPIREIDQVRVGDPSVEEVLHSKSRPIERRDEEVL